MKKTIIAFAMLMAVSTTIFAQAKQDSSKKNVQEKKVTTKYTCKMHPEIVRTKPGKCPKCGMALVPLKEKTTKKNQSMDGMKM